MKVKVYGFNHSPWVQAVLLALHDQKIEHDVYQIPSLKIFNKWGIYMPVVSIDENPAEIESTKILQKLGYNAIAQNELRAIQGTWQGVFHRANNPLKFFSAWAHDADAKSNFFKRSINNFLLSFTTFYMFILINLINFRSKNKDPKNFGDQYLFWESELNKSESLFLDGDNPGTRDLLLFGIIQCHASLPVPPLEALQNDARLVEVRNWISKMQVRFKDYVYLHSGEHFEPSVTKTNRTSFLQRCVFYFGMATMFIGFPLSLALVFWCMRKVPR